MLISRNSSGAQVGRVRVQPVEHAAHGVFEQVCVLDRLDVVAFHAVEDLDEGLQVLQRQVERARFGRRFALGQNAVGQRDAGADQHTKGKQERGTCLGSHDGASLLGGKKQTLTEPES